MAGISVAGAIPRIQGTRVQAKEGRWSVCFEKEEAPTLRLFCFPHAGGGVQAYKSWSSVLSAESVEVHAINLPGRGSRQAEEASVELRILINSIVDAITSLLDLPYAIFGHSWGSVLGFEVMCEIRRRDLPEACLLMVSAHKAPSASEVGAASWTHTLDDGAFVHAATKWYDRSFLIC
jgi:surfactin synthase thioesterase subunit